MTHHDLKSFSRNFEAVDSGKKKNECRYNDRNYQIGDTITLHDGQHEDGEFKYTGKTISARICYIDDFGCQQGYVNLSLEDVGLLIA